MPELPEVDTVRARLAPELEGRRLEHVTISDPRLTRPVAPEDVARRLEGERVAAVERRGKYLVVRFESGRALLIHLRMTGSLLHEPNTAHESNTSHEPHGSRHEPRADDPYRRAVVRLDDGSDVAYRDVRRFGTWQLLEPDEAAAELDRKLGPEPLGRGFTTAFLADRLAGRRAPLKAAILDQRTVAGLGNIYADEGLWHAQLGPRRESGTLSAEELARLREGVRKALRTGIRLTGADLGDGVYGGGAMQDEFKVYGRAGEPCARCGTPIEKTKVGGRGTWYCPSCQRPVAGGGPL